MDDDQDSNGLEISAFIEHRTKYLGKKLRVAVRDHWRINCPISSRDSKVVAYIRTHTLYTIRAAILYHTS